jgi:hypothetical protein
VGGRIGDEHKAFLAHDNIRYSFPDRCVICLGPVAHHVDLASSATVRLVKTVRMTPVSHEWKQRDVRHSIHVPAVPYCDEHQPELGSELSRETHGLDLRARRQGGDPEIDPPYIEVDRLVFEFTNPEYAALFRSTNGLRTPVEHRREVAGTVARGAPGFVRELFRLDTWRIAMLDQAAQKKAAKPLVKALSHVRVRIRREALIKIRFASLMQHDVVLAARPLIAALAGDDEPRFRWMALDTLTKMGADRADLPFYIDACDDEDPAVRCHAIWGLQAFDDAEAVAALLRLLADDDEDVRVGAVVALRRHGDVARDRLIQALEDPSEKVRTAARSAL